MLVINGISSFTQLCFCSSYTNCGLTADGWIASTIFLDTFEDSCYYFKQNPALNWDQAWKTCRDMSSDSRLVVIETNSEFNWIMSMYSTNYAFIGGLYVDATRGRCVRIKNLIFIQIKVNIFEIFYGLYRHS